jgi:hypothetical protein
MGLMWGTVLGNEVRLVQTRKGSGTRNCEIGVFVVAKILSRIAESCIISSLVKFCYLIKLIE